MSLTHTQLSQGLFLAGTLSLLNGAACSNVAAQTSVSPAASASASAAPASSASVATTPKPVDPTEDKQEGRAGIATLCIEKRSYVDVNSLAIVTPTVYLDDIPANGINTLYVPNGKVATMWKTFLDPKNPARKEWLEDTDIPDQANEAIKLIKQLDKNTDGIVSKDEFDRGMKGQDKEEKRRVLGLINSLACDNLYFAEGPLNTVDPEMFPVVIKMRSDMEVLGTTAKAAINNAQTERDDYKSKFYGMCVLSGLLAMGLIATKVRNRGKVAAPAATSGAGNPPPHVTTTPAPATPPVGDVGYADALSALGSGGPGPDVLAALGDDTPPPPAAAPAPLATPAPADPIAVAPAPGGPPPLPGGGGSGTT